MFYLYLKQHNVTGLNYLGQTKKDPFVYQGSGTHWMRHIKKHGYDVTTTVLYETPFKEEMRELGLYFSDLWNIVDSKEFANMKPESGDGSYGRTFTEEAKRKMSESAKGRIHSDETRQKMSKSHKGSIHSYETRQKMGESLKGRIFSEEHKQKMREVHKGKPQSKSTCPHCGKTGGVANMSRWHFDNCKSK